MDSMMLSVAPHIPVLYHAVIENAAIRSGELWVDCTLGRGGHCEALLEAGAFVIGFDKDPEAITYSRQRLSRFGDRFQAVSTDFKQIKSTLNSMNVQSVDGILADLGVSSPQLDQARRGFSFKSSGPVDMRMNPAQEISATELIQNSSVSELAGILRRYGEEPFAGPIARSMKKWSEEGGGDTISLAQVVESAIPSKVRRKIKKHPATRTFQALRIKVNDELGALELLLRDAPSLLKYRGRLLIISFHSLEDRCVKQAYRALSMSPYSPRRGLPPPP